MNLASLAYRIEHRLPHARSAVVVGYAGRGVTPEAVLANAAAQLGGTGGELALVDRSTGATVARLVLAGSSATAQPRARQSAA
jgi:hypothetical protein